MKPINVALAIWFAAVLAYDCLAQGPGKRPFGQRGSAPRGLYQGTAGQPGRGRLADRDPSQIVARLTKEFDKDGDQKLDSTELSALLTSLRERRAAFATGSGGREAAQSSERPGKFRRLGAESGGNPGGTPPKRPADE